MRLFTLPSAMKLSEKQFGNWDIAVRRNLFMPVNRSIPDVAQKRKSWNGLISGFKASGLTDGSRAVSTKKEDPLSELQLREGVFFLVSQTTSSISTFTIYSICHSPQKSSIVQKVYNFAHTPGTSSLRASSRRAVPSGRSLAASIWPGETW